MMINFRRQGKIPVLIIFALTIFCFPFPLGAEESRAEPEQPNLVLIIADDLGFDDCTPFGGKHVHTPNLQRLADEGMRFDHAFLTCSSCSPSRSTMITGRYPHNTGAEQLHWPLPKDQITFVEQLKAKGYWTGQAGKWHLGNAVKNRFDVLYEMGNSAFQLSKDGKGKIRGKGDGSGCENWLPLLKSRPKDKPFFMWLASADPHRDYEPNTFDPPHRPENAFVPSYLPDVPETRKDLVMYYDEIARLDRYIGLVLHELKRQNVEKNTMILFLSDNGRPFPRCKTTIYDSGIRTPLIVRWPDKIKANSVCHQLVSSVDLASTFLDLAKIKPGKSFQGKSFVPLFTNPNAKIREEIYAEHNWHDYESRSRAVRTLRYKYILNEYPDLPNTPPADAVRSPTYQAMIKLYKEGKLPPKQSMPFMKPLPVEEFYDLQVDPDELVNLAQDPKWQNVKEDLAKRLTNWKKETADITPTSRTPDEFDRTTGRVTPARKLPRLPPKDRFKK